MHIILYLVYSMVLTACYKSDQQARLAYEGVEGETMGTYYIWKASDIADAEATQLAVDSILQLINDIASTYIEDSDISRMNRADQTYCVEINSPAAIHLTYLWEVSGRIYEKSEHFFDPTILPLVDLYGFGSVKRGSMHMPPSDSVHQVLQYIGMDLWRIKRDDQELCFIKPSKHAKLDFSSVAKGYGVDLLANYLSSKSDNVYVNIGGEVVAHGLNEKGQPWRLGINYPDTAASLTELYAYLQDEHIAMATSGNYRHYYQADGHLLAHTINPLTGDALPSDLLSATIKARSCAEADAYATACMAMGYARARRMIEASPDIGALLIYQDSSGVLQSYITEHLDVHLTNHD